MMRAIAPAAMSGGTLSVAGPVRIYLDSPARSGSGCTSGGRFFVDNGATINSGGSPASFLVLVHDGDEDVEIPNKPFTFKVLKNAQAAGDLESLRARGRSAEWVRLTGADAATAVRELTTRVTRVLTQR